MYSKALNQSINQSVNLSIHPLMVEHICLSSSAYDIICNQYFNVCSFQELFEKTHSQHILNFIKDTGIYKEILIIKYHILNMYILIC